MPILVDSHVKEKESHLRNLMCYKSQLVASQHFIKQYVRKRVYNDADALDVVQEINRVALEKEAAYKKDYTFVGIDPSKCKLSSSYGGTSWIIPDKSCKDPNGINAIPQVIIFRKWISGICKFQIKAYLTRVSRSPELVEFCRDSHSIRLNSPEEDPRHLLSNKEKSIEVSNKIDHVYSVIGERPGKFLKLYLEGKSRSFIMKKLNMSQSSYYSTKLRLIRKARVVMGCKP